MDRKSAQRFHCCDSEDYGLPASLVEVMTGAAKLPLTLGLHGNNFTYM
jgi:hypothetical protein